MSEKLVDISDMLTDKGFKDLKRGNVLRFNDGTELRIVRLNRRKRTCYAERITTMTVEEFDAKYEITDKSSSK